jgi:hypothetical protein
MLMYYVCTFSFHRESPDIILGDESPHFWGGSVTVGYQSKIKVKHILRHLKITTTLSERNS